MSLHRLGQPGLLSEIHQPDLGGVVAVLGDRLALRDKARARLQHRDRVNVTLVIEELRHADFLAENSVDCHCCFLNSASSLLPFAATGACAAEALFCTARSYLCSFPNALISTSTPAGSSSFISASTVCWVGSRISSRRLWVRISNASRDFLSTWGERRTQYLFFMVGSGMGPATWAPVRLAVSTISPVDVSSTR